MKSKIIGFLSILITCLVFSTWPRQAQANVMPRQVGVSITGFYDALRPYGRWMDYGGYGQVWVPAVGAGFRPYYTNGHWVYSDYGWTWVSDYPWGWAPFHYGRWIEDDYYGWIWVPDDVWGPAWVSWRTGSDYYGWAPLGPHMSIGVSINIPAAHWAFVPCGYITSPHMSRYYIDRSRNTYIINRTTVINNTVVVNNNRYYRGPEVRDVERVTRSRVRTVRIADSDRPGTPSVSRNQLRIYRPQQAALRQSLAENNRRVTRGVQPNNNNNGVTDRPNTPGRTTRRVAPADNNGVNRTLPAPNNNLNNTPDNRPDNGRVPRRAFDRNDNFDRNNNFDRDNDNNNRVLPAPSRTPDMPRTMPDRSAPDRNMRRIDEGRNRSIVPPTPAPSRPAPAPRQTMPERQPRPERSFSQPPRPANNPGFSRPQPRMEAPRSQPSQPRMQSAPSQPRGNGGGRVSRGRDN